MATQRKKTSKKDLIAVMLESKIAYTEKVYKTSMEDYIASSKKVDRDRALIYKGKLSTYKEVLLIINSTHDKG